MHIRRTLVALAAASLVPALATAQALPDGKALVAKHIVAMGGREALDKHSSLHMSGTFSIPAAGMEGAVHMYRAKPALLLVQVTLGAVGEITTGFDGTTAWSINPMAGVSVMSGEQAAQTKQQADFFADFPDPSRFSTIESIAAEDFEGRKCYKVRLVRADGSGEAMQFFDVETGLMAGMSRTLENPQMGKIDVLIITADYKDQGGIRLPSKITQRTPQGEFVQTFTAFEWDTVEAKIFELPDAVKSMVKP